MHAQTACGHSSVAGVVTTTIQQLESKYGKNVTILLYMVQVQVQVYVLPTRLT